MSNKAQDKKALREVQAGALNARLLEQQVAEGKAAAKERIRQAFAADDRRRGRLRGTK